MEPRYDAPAALNQFNPQRRLDLWVHFTRSYASREWTRRKGTPPTIEDWSCLPKNVSPEAVGSREAIVGHEVVAFLEEFVAQSDRRWHPFIHYGLTSSDLVDNALLVQLRMHASKVTLLNKELYTAVNTVAYNNHVPRAGRTHGQLAEVTSLKHQLYVWLHVLRQIDDDLNSVYIRLQVTKSPGPTGDTPLRRDHIGHVIPSTQVVPRDYVLAWATVYARLATHLENLALLVRLGSRSEIAEIREGRSANRVGSSAMPHKRNPIDSEKVTGLARVVRAHAWGSIAESVVLWEDRDLTQSSAERVACPAIAQFTEHSLTTMIQVMNELVVNKETMTANAASDDCFTSIWQGLLMKHLEISFIEARALVHQGIDSNEGLVPFFTGLYEAHYPELLEEYKTIRKWVGF